MKYRVKYILIAIGLVFLLETTAFSQSIFIQKRQSKQNFFSFGIGYEYLFMKYDVKKRLGTGNLEVIKQASQFHGMVVNSKFIAFKPLGVLASIHFYFPFSIRESVYFPTINPKDKQIKIVNNGTYMLKNTQPSDVLKGLGITSTLGINYAFKHDQNTINLGGGLAWVVFSEDVYANKRASRTTSMLGLIVDADYQFTFTRTFGLTLGGKFAYYPLELFSVRNKVGDYAIKTTTMTEFSILASLAFFF